MTILQTSIDERKVLKAIRAYCAANNEIACDYKKAKKVVRAYRRPAFYEVSTRCNLFCEGCYYFESPQESQLQDPGDSPDEWEAFFRAENQRGVSMAYFVGAEPALEPKRLFRAKRYFPFNNMGTNGTIKVDKNLPFRIGVSAWAATDEADIKLRGAAAFRKALKNFEGDSRAIILFTVSAWNLQDIPLIVRMCVDHGIDLTFNFYSPTETFLDRLMNNSIPSQYLRESTSEDTPQLSDTQLIQARNMIEDARVAYPETVLISPNVNKILTKIGSIYDLDEDGIALSCGSKITGKFKYFKADKKEATLKCATPSIKCSECRTYSGVWSTRFKPNHIDIASEANFKSWLTDINMLGRIFLHDNPYYEEVSDHSTLSISNNIVA